MVANAGDQYRSRQLAPAVLHTARRAYALSMERRVTGKVPVRPLPCSVNTGWAPACVSTGASAGVDTKQCSVHHHTAHALHNPPRVCTPQDNTPHSVHLQHPVCCCRSQVRAVHPVAPNGRSCGQSFQTPATAGEAKESLHKAKQGV